MARSKVNKDTHKQCFLITFYALLLSSLSLPDCLWLVVHAVQTQLLLARRMLVKMLLFLVSDFGAMTTDDILR